MARRLSSWTGPAGAGVNGFTITAGNSTIRGFAINRFTNGVTGGFGISITGAGTTGDVVAGNYIGTDVTGTVSEGNTSYGVHFDLGASNNTIGGLTAADRNVIAGSQIGVGLFNSSNNNVIEGNYIGTDYTGTVALANGRGVVVGSSASGTIIGGTSAAARNVISGNTGIGVHVTSGTGTIVEGNYIGLAPDGITALGNGGDGVRLSNGTTGNTVGGTTAGAGNVIAGNGFGGNGGFGVVIQDAGTNANLVAGNIIGLAADGSTVRGNDSGGVFVGGGSSNNTVGGTTAAARNVISGNNADGIEITSAGTSGNVVEGNYIGTNAAGTAALGNASYGVLVHNGANSTTIGGFTATPGTGAGNVISGNQTGISIQDTTTDSVTIQGNLIGTNAAGTAAIGNAAAGILINGNNNSTSILIGGTPSGGLVATNVVSGTTGASQPFALNGGPGCGIYTNQAGAGVVIEGNYVGTDVTGTVALANHLSGIGLTFGSAVIQVGGAAAGAGNVLSGNTQYGLSVSRMLAGGISNVFAQNNYIGTNAAGTAALANGSAGVLLNGQAASTLTGNVISGNTGVGVDLIGTSNQLIVGNYIGTNAAGTGAVPNHSYGGIFLDGASGSNTIGGTSAGAGTRLAATAAAAFISITPSVATPRTMLSRATPSA